jgi:hypothetical protein
MHSRKGNVGLSPKVVEVDGVPRVCFIAKWQLNIGDQVLYDCGVKLPFADLVSISHLLTLLLWAIDVNKILCVIAEVHHQQNGPLPSKGIGIFNPSTDSINC